MARKGGRRKVTPEMMGEMRGLRKEGLTYKEIAERFDVAPMTVYNYLKKKERVGFFKRPERKIVPIAIVIVAVSVAFVGYYLLTRQGGHKEVEFMTYTNENYSFKFDYPANWDFMESSGLVGTFRVPLFVAVENTLEIQNVILHHENRIEGGYVAVAILDKAIYENLSGVSLDNLTSLVNMIENNENYVLTSKLIEIAIDNHSGVRFSAITTKENHVTRTQHELVVKDNYLYEIVAVTEFVVGTSEQRYSIYEPIFEHVINSFSFLD